MSVPLDVRGDALALWGYLRMRHRPRPCSVAIVLGSHDMGVADVAVDAYRRGYVPLMVMSGATSVTSRARMPRGEAVHYRERAVESGVPAAAVLVEPRATNTGENIVYSRELLESAGIEVTSVLLVSKPYEERRAYATIGKLWPSVTVVCASTSAGYEEYVAAIGDERLVIDMMVGAVQRIMIYPGQGLITRHDVPTEVAAAYSRLCERGFTRRLAGDRTRTTP